MNFIPYKGDLIDLPINENYLVFRWVSDYDCKILFSMARQGNALSCHFASDKKGLRHLKQAFEECFEFCFELFDWCEMILARINKPSIKRLAEKCNFNLIRVNKTNTSWVYVRCKNG